MPMTPKGFEDDLRRRAKEAAKGDAKLEQILFLSVCADLNGPGSPAAELFEKLLAEYEKEHPE